jgi:2-dehydro-3-deoxygalactonokinase
VTAPRIIGDWGNSRLRLWRLLDGAVMERRDGPGIAAVSDPADALVTALGGWDARQVVLCGMAGARNGLHEAPYLPCPAGVAEWASRAVEFELAGRRIAIASGLTQTESASHPDLMRGEETQIFGAVVRHPALASGRHLIVLPGTHSKWAWLVDGRIDSFRTFITGELFEMLKRSSLFTVGDPEAEMDMEAGFSDGLSRHSGRAELSSLLFEARSAQLVEDRSPGWASGFVSGILIGAEIAEMQPGDGVTLIAEPNLAALYARALALRGLNSVRLDSEGCTIAGLGLLDAGD